jgi:very-short-patch-repair endonuclease
MAEDQAATGIDIVRRLKALQLARYLKEFVGLRSVTIRDVDKYEKVLWFGDIPQEPECQSSAWNDNFEPGSPLLEVRKQQFPKLPEPPTSIVPWIDQQALKRAAADIPELRSSILVADVNVVLSDGEEPPLVATSLAENPEVVRDYERYRPKWESWSAEYRRRSGIQEIYAELFGMHTQVRKQGEIVELALGLGLLTWRSPVRGASVPIRRHVVTARVDLHFDPSTGTIRLDTAADGAQLRIEDDMLEAELRPDRGYYEGLCDQLNEIGDDIWDHARMHGALKSWAGILDSNSQWSADLKPGTDVAGRALVTFAPALILRKRNQTGMVRIYEALIQRLSSDDIEVPSGWGSLIDDEDDQDGGGVRLPPDPGVTPQMPAAQETYFPLPANLEQGRIARAIDQRRGVLVQGPPGTGKSHTIANLMCHLLATGKRVLVTAETGHALQVLKNKLPEEIRPLCVSLLGQGGNSFSELNSAVQGITTRYAAYSPGAYDKRIAEIDRELDSGRRALARMDADLRGLREGETSTHSLANGTYQGTASAIAERVALEREAFAWLRLPVDAVADPPLSSAELATWLRIVRTYGHDAIASARLVLVPSERLAIPAAFGQLVAIEVEAKAAVDQLSELRGHVAYRAIVGVGLDVRDALRSELRSLDDCRRKLHAFKSDWLSDAIAAVLSGRPAYWEALFERSSGLVATISELVTQLGSSIVVIPQGKDPKVVRADAAAVREHLENGGKWTTWGFFIPRALRSRKYLREQVMVNGLPADSPEKLKLVCTHLDVRSFIEDLERAWSDHGGLPPGSDVRLRLASIEEHVGVLGKGLAYARQCLALGRTMAATVPPIPEPDWRSADMQTLLRILDASTIEDRHRSATEGVADVVRSLQGIRDLHDAHPVIAALLTAVERRDVGAYSQAYAEVQRLETVRRDQMERQRIESILDTVLPSFRKGLSAFPQDPVWDGRFERWTQAWHWAVADNWLEKRADPTYQDQLWRRRNDTDKVLGKLVGESAALRAWTHFFARLSTKEAASLKSWREAVKAMGKGTGRSAKMERLRREARRYMDQCREAIPVWVMPRYLVAEMVDPLPGRYDLVIVDEASQLGIESLFLFYIAKKIVVVGDDQQISPYGIGIPDDAIEGLQQHYLDGIPHHHALSAQSSLYGNAKIRFGQNIVLREHFRCMPEIIQFSNDLCYASNGTPLDPLRAYPANRLQPLVSRHVVEGYRTGSSQNAINEPEADAIVAQVISCIDDPRYSGRTFGVISLQGEAQAKLIEQKLLQRLDPEVIEARRLICGDAYAFQGDERHVMFLSMVAAPNERIGALAADNARQRFNVAASRAQDQLWLFHSVTLEVLSPSCMRHHLLSYMLAPARKETEEAEQRFESKLERDVYRLVTARGFHVRTQVVVGDPTNHRYRIDLVVEGMRGRLAVECDGDEWHGPDRYEHDMARQRDLERSGWQFIRIRGGDFYRNPSLATGPLWAELGRLGIQPGGIDQAAAEPPPPADIDRLARREVEESIPLVVPAASGVDSIETLAVPVESGAPDGHAPRPSEPDEAVIGPKDTKSPFSPYVEFEGQAGDDPRTVGSGAVADGLCRIIAVEGPMLAKRAYDVYLRGCGIKRMGHELKTSMNKALAVAIRQGRVVAEDETAKGGFLYSVVRLKGTAPVVLRSRGPRVFEEIPPSEILTVAAYLAQRQNLEIGSDEHLRAILECFDLRRLTTQVGKALLDTVKRKYPYVDDVVRDQRW